MIRRLASFLHRSGSSAVSGAADFLSNALDFVWGHAAEVVLGVLATATICVFAVGMLSLWDGHKEDVKAREAAAVKGDALYERDVGLSSVMHSSPPARYVNFETTIITVEGHRYLVAISRNGAMTMIRLDDPPPEKKEQK